jgi:hypothetical protein
MRMKASVSGLPWCGRQLANGEEFEVADAQASRLFRDGHAEPIDTTVAAEALIDGMDGGQPFKAGDRVEMRVTDYLERLGQGRVARWESTSTWMPPTDGVLLEEAFRVAVIEARELAAIREVERAVGSDSSTSCVLYLREFAASADQPVLWSEPTDPGPPPIAFVANPTASQGEAFFKYWDRDYAYETRDQRRPVRIRIYRETQLVMNFLAALRDGRWVAWGFRPADPKRRLEKIAAAWWSDPDLVLDCGNRSELRPTDAMGPSGAHYRGIVIKPSPRLAKALATGVSSRRFPRAECIIWIERNIAAGTIPRRAEVAWAAARRDLRADIPRDEFVKLRRELLPVKPKRGRPTKNRGEQ